MGRIPLHWSVSFAGGFLLCVIGSYSLAALLADAGGGRRSGLEDACCGKNWMLQASADVHGEWCGSFECRIFTPRARLVPSEFAHHFAKSPANSM